MTDTLQSFARTRATDDFAALVRPYSSLIYATALTRALNLRRDESRRRRREAAVPPPASGEPEWAAISAEIDAAIAELPPDQRALIIDHYLRAISQQQLSRAGGAALARC